MACMDFHSSLALVDGGRAEKLYDVVTCVSHAWLLKYQEYC